uniref:Uncharacterized protein n=1 Tax=Oryza brachyantha TaxID=4533 RepID=J3LDF5_ORYBR
PRILIEDLTATSPCGQQLPWSAGDWCFLFPLDDQPRWALQPPHRPQLFTAEIPIAIYDDMVRWLQVRQSWHTSLQNRL